MLSAPGLNRVHDPREFIDVLSPINLHLADDADCEAGRAVAAELISPNVALTAAFQRVQAKTGSSVWVYRQDGVVTAILGMVALRPEGLEALLQYRYKSLDPSDECLCAPGDPFPAMYGWGFAARTRRASAAVVMGAMRLRDLYPDIPFFTRAATPAGVKVICGRMGYSPLPGAPDDMLWNPIRSSQERAA